MFGQAFGEPDKPEDKNDDSKGGKTEMKHNVFDNEKKLSLIHISLKIPRGYFSENVFIFRQYLIELIKLTK